MLAPSQFNLSEWAIRNQQIVLYLLLAILVAGGFSYFQLPQKEDPDFTFKVMTVTIDWPGASARDIAAYITTPVEYKLQETPWLDNVTSYSKAGESGLFVTLKDEMPAAELQGSWQAARKLLAAVQLPKGAGPIVINDELGTTYGSILALSSDSVPNAELAKHASAMRTELLKLPQVAKVEILGAQAEKIYVEPNAIKGHPTLDLEQIAKALREYGVISPAGELTVEGATTRLRIAENDRFSLEDLQNLPLHLDGQTYRLGDICRIYRATEDPAHFKMHYGGKPSIGVAIALAQNGDAIKLGQLLQKRVEHFKVTLPAGIEIHQVANQPQVVKHSISQFMGAMLEALLVVLAVSFLSLGLRAGIVVALSIPIVLAATFTLMRFFNIELHRVSVGALIIAMGLLVDDAIIAVEMMKVKLAQGLPRSGAAVFAYKTTAWPMLTGTFITIAAFLPVGLAQSAAGEYTSAICAVVTISLVASWFVAVIFTPLIGYHLLDEHQSHSEEIYQSAPYRFLRRIVESCLSHRKLVITATLLLLALSIAGFTRIEQAFFPPSERNELLMDIWLPENAAFSSTESVTHKIETQLNRYAGIESFTSYIGDAAPRFYLPLDVQIPAVNHAQIVVMTRDLQNREAVFKQLQHLVNEESDAALRVSRLENGPPVGLPIQYRIVGQDPEQAKKIAEKVLKVVQSTPGTKHVSQDGGELVTSLRVEIDRENLNRHGLSATDVSRQLQTWVTGEVVGQYPDPDQKLDIVLRVETEKQPLSSWLPQLSIHAPDGAILPLGSIAKISPSLEEGILWRLNGLPMVTLSADIEDSARAQEVSASIDTKLDEFRKTLPVGYQIETGGESEDSDKSTSSIVAALPLAVFIVLTLLMLQLKRFNLAAMALLTAPLGVIGAYLALTLFEMPLGFVAMLGIISLSGMIMRNSIILIDQINQDIAQGSSLHEAIVSSTIRRSRPIVLTAATAMLAMIPLSRNIFWGPMAITIMGGLCVATFLTLFFLPALYALWFDKHYKSRASETLI